MNQIAKTFCRSMLISCLPWLVRAETFQSFPMDTDPGWSTEGAWAFGQPLGGGTYNLDPMTGHTGINVYGYNLSGNYSNYMPEYWLTTTPMDCSTHENVVLRFYRWLGVEDAIFDQAEIQVSNDGSTWNSVWSHTGYSIKDYSWQEKSYDISATADGKATVYIRWGMGPTDSSVTFPGWNIDDVSLEGDPVDELGISPLEGFAFAGYEGGPFSPTQTIYTLTNLSTSTPISWSTGGSASWLSVTPASGSLPPMGTTNVCVALNTNALSMATGSYVDSVVFSNQFSGTVHTREVTLEILAPPGEIEVADSIPPTNDLNLPYGDTIIGSTRTEQVTLSNSDGSNDLIVAGISLSAGSMPAGNATPSSTGMDVLMLASSSDPSTLRNALAAFPDFATVDYFDGASGTPTAAFLAGYDAVAVLNNDPFLDPTATGDVLADFIDIGGVVVQAESTFTPDFGLELGGRFANEGYEPFVSGPLLLDFSPWYLGAYDTGHPIMDGVSTLSDYLICDVGLKPAAEWVADWNDGTPLVAVSDKGVVGINIYAMDDGLYGGNVALLFRNALVNATASGFSIGELPPLPYAIQPGSNLVVDVAYAPERTGSNSASLVIASNDSDESEVVIALSGNGILDYLEVTPEDGLVASGHPGGPFTPVSRNYELKNTGMIPVNWQASANEPWVSVTPSSGTLSTGATTTVTVGFAAAANALPEGLHTDTVTFSNITTGIEQTRNIQLDVFTTPQISVAPIYGFIVTNHPGQLQSRTMVVSNALAADGNLDYSIRTIETGRNETPGTSTAESASTSSAGSVSLSTSSAPCRPDRLLVRFAPGLDVAAQHARASSLGANIHKRFTIVSGLCVVELEQGTDMNRSLNAFKRSAGVMYAQPDYLWHANNLPNDPSFNLLWGMNNTGQSGGTPDADIDAPGAWDVTIGNQGVVVAVIDTGVDYTHPDLDDNMWTNPGEIPGNGLDDDGNGYVDDVHGYDFVNNDGDPMDDHYHGTHCAGTVGAEGNNGEGVAGVCWNVRIMALKFLDATGYGSTADAISCIEYAKQMGAKVTSNSWSGGSNDQALKDAIDSAGALGITFVAAAGNDSMNNDATPAYPSSFDSECIISVVSSDRNDDLSTFSNYGLTSTDLAAPGSSIYSCEPGGGYQYLSGTSMATPHVAGACALLLSANPYLSPSEIRQILIDTVDPTLPGVCVSGGRMNLERAVAESGASWMRAEPSFAFGIVPGESANVRVDFDAATLVPGSYTGEVVVASNDPDFPSIVLPAIMVVEPDPLDEDGDGIPDWWETLYFGNPSNCLWDAICANGYNTMLEAYVAGLDPTDQDSVFMITNMTQVGSNFVIVWPSVAGRVYSTRWTDSLTNQFQTLEAGIEYPRNSCTDTIHGAEASGFYDVEVQLQ